MIDGRNPILKSSITLYKRSRILTRYSLNLAGNNPFTQFITLQHISSGFSPCLPRWLSLKTYLHHPKLAQECTRLQVIRCMHSAQHKQWLPHFALKREAFEWFESILKVRRSSFYRFWTSCKSAVEPRPCCFHAAPKETTRFSL